MTTSTGGDRCRPDRLPHAAGYFSKQGITLIGRGDWRSALCPFHDDGNTSLRVHSESGAFRCLTCGAHASDVTACHGEPQSWRSTPQLPDLIAALHRVADAGIALQDARNEGAAPEDINLALVHAYGNLRIACRLAAELTGAADA